MLGKGHDPARKRPKTVRGENVRKKVCDAAARMLHDSWIDQLPITALAKEAGVARASLLLQYPGGWPDIAYDIMGHWLDQLDEEIAGQEPCRNVSELSDVLVKFVETASQHGLMFANLRSQMFVSDRDLASAYRISLMDAQDVIERLICGQDEYVFEADVAAEGILNFTLDLCAGTSFYKWDTGGRADAIRKLVDMMRGGFCQP